MQTLQQAIDHPERDQPAVVKGLGEHVGVTSNHVSYLEGEAYIFGRHISSVGSQFAI